MPSSVAVQEQAPATFVRGHELREALPMAGTVTPASEKANIALCAALHDEDNLDAIVAAINAHAVTTKISANPFAVFGSFRNYAGEHI